MLPSWHPALVALHIICMTTFFSGTFLLLRALARQRQILAKEEPERTILDKEYRSLGRTPLYLVAWPSLVLLILSGAGMVWLRPGLLAEPWMQAKLGLTALLFAYHLVNHRIYRKVQQGGEGWGSFALGIWAQGAVLMLVVAVFLSTFKEVDWYIGVLGLVVLAVMLYAAIRGLGGKEKVPGATTERTGSGDGPDQRPTKS